MVIFYLGSLILIFYLLAKVCDQYFVKSLDIIAQKWKLSDDVAGATLMAVGSSAPEFFTALIALTKVGSEQVGAGTIVGSAIFNILVIVGMSAVASTAILSWRPVIRDLLFYIFSIVLLLVTFSDGIVTLHEAGVYLLIYILYVFILSRWSNLFPNGRKPDILISDVQALEKEEKNISKRHGILPFLISKIDHALTLVYPSKSDQEKKYVRTFFISVILIIIMSYGLVELAVGLAHEIGIPEVIIALTILAGGTSIPDLISSYVVAKKGRGDMAVSNAVGSNTFDILIGLGLPWFFYVIIIGKNVTVGTENLLSSILLLFFTVITLLFILVVQKFKIGKKSGYILLFIYFAYIFYSVYMLYFPII